MRSRFWLSYVMLLLLIFGFANVSVASSFNCKWSSVQQSRVYNHQVQDVEELYEEDEFALNINDREKTSDLIGYRSSGPSAIHWDKSNYHGPNLWIKNYRVEGNESSIELDEANTVRLILSDGLPYAYTTISYEGKCVRK